MTVSQFRAVFPLFGQIPDADVRRTIRAAGRELRTKHFPTPPLRKAMAPHRNALLGNLVAHRLTLPGQPPSLRSTFARQYIYLRRLA